jgi:hypothetical protein
MIKAPGTMAQVPIANTATKSLPRMTASLISYQDVADL